MYEALARVEGASRGRQVVEGELCVEARAEEAEAALGAVEGVEVPLVDGVEDVVGEALGVEVGLGFEDLVVD